MDRSSHPWSDRRGRRQMHKRPLVVVASLLVLVGCAPDEPADQAEELGSIAAEGALLAHGVAEGGSTDTFAREHAKALGRLLAELRPALEQPELERLGERVSSSLAALAADAGDREHAGRLEQRLDAAAARAAELAG